MLRLTNLNHDYDGHRVLGLKSFTLNQGEQALILGPSGSGKSTLLHLAAGVLRPSGGEVVVCGQSLGGLPEAALDRFRGRHIGLVYQRFHLLGALTAAANLALAQYMAGLPADSAAVSRALSAVGLQDKAQAYPHQLSQGQQQRVAIARALVNGPRLILADEPTASLDDANAEQVLDLLIAQAASRDATLLIATHDARVSMRIERCLELNARGMPA
ncbi:MAG: ABC transporter ATP-binding protein [Salinisphaeraceae bacterium]|nr:ABC transporter ATP-binding protein [Salinisphaeraceae bacterium]